MTTHRLYAIFASKKERDAMADFLKQADWAGLLQSEASSMTSALMTGDQMGLGARLGAKTLGFSGTSLPQWAWTMASWMAWRSSHRAHGGVTADQDTLSDSLHHWPVVVWDDEEIPVLDMDRYPEVEDACRVDADGLLARLKDRALPQGPDLAAQQSVFEQLTTQWDTQMVRARRRKV